MSEQGNAAIRAGQVAESQGMWLHRNARFIDPWKKAVGQIADARLRTGRPLGTKSSWALNQLANWTIGKANPTTGVRSGGPAVGREAARWHTPQEFQDPFDQSLQRGQQQPFERQPEQSAGGNLSQEQFGGEGDGRHGPFGRPGSQPI